ncbi:MAG: hypothetical protein KBF98_09930 [Rhodoferax sp.]|nr:hypothetical protein [Rhodoferax sp.]
MEFCLFTPETLKATKTGWIKDAASGAGFLPDIEQRMDWVENHLCLEGNSVAYGVFDGKTRIAVGICELVITKPDPKKAWVKFIRLHFRPKIDEQIFGSVMDGIQTAINAYITCVIGILNVKNEHNASIIKVYGRTPGQISFLKLLDSALKDKQEASFKSSIEGRWLVLKWGKS